MNKEILQNHNNIIAKNNADIDSVLEIINGLPTIQEPILQDKVIDIVENGTHTITFDGGYTGLNTVTLNIQVGETIQGEDINDYQLVEYIKTTSYAYGANYIETGIYPTNKTSLETQYAFYTLDTSYSRIYGSSGLFEVAAIAQSDTRVLGLWNNVVTGNIGKEADYNKHVIKQAKNILYYDDNVVHTFEDAEWEDTNMLRLFSATVGDRDGKLQMYYCKIWEDSTLVRDFVPCYRKSDSVIGMFDKVENKFYEAKGTVAFEKGANITA